MRLIKHFFKIWVGWSIERWIASHKLMGYTYNPEENCVQKHHSCICVWDKLDEVTHSYDSNVIDAIIKMTYDKALKKNKQ